jgi:DNA-binding MarR family transcriptional regulator
MSESNQNCEWSEVTTHLIQQFLELEANLIRLKMNYKANLAQIPAGHGGRRGFDFNPRTGQGRILAILKLQPEIEQKELGYLLDMSRQALAELLAKLEKSEYITRTQSEKDRRSYVVTLTEAGRKIADQVAAADADNDDDPLGLSASLNTLSPDEQQQLSEYLERISTAIRERLGSSCDSRDDFAEFFREKFFNRHGFDQRDLARFGFGRPGGFGGFGHDPRDRFDGRDPRLNPDGSDPRSGRNGRDPRIDRRTRAFF